MAGNPPTVSSYTLPPWAQYIGLIALLIGSVVASYVLKILPTALGNLTSAVSIVGIFTFASHDLEQEGAPAGFPRWTSWVVLTIGSVGMGAVGSFTGQTLLTVGALVTWIVLLLGLVYHDVAQDGGTNFSLNAEMWFLSFVGVAISLLVWYAAGAMDGVAGLIAAFVAAVPMYFHLAAGSITPAPPPSPTPS